MAWVLDPVTQQPVITPPEQIAQQRKIADALVAQGAASRNYAVPGGAWQGIADGFKAGLGGFLEGQTNRAQLGAYQASQDSYNKIISAMMGGDTGGADAAPAAAPPSPSGPGLQPPMPTGAPPAVTYASGAPGAGDMGAWKNAIGNKIESGGRYDLLGPITANGDRAYGKYQVMGNNIPEWTKAAFGAPLTKEQFLASPDAQEKVFEHQFGGYVQKYGNPEDAASAWFTGGPRTAKSMAAKDVLGTTGASYVKQFDAAVGTGGAATPVQSGTPPVGPAPGPAPGPINGGANPQHQLAALMAAAANPYLSDAQRQVLNTAMAPYLKQIGPVEYGFSTSTDGTLIRTNPRTGAAEAAYTAQKPLSTYKADDGSEHSFNPITGEDKIIAPSIGTGEWTATDLGYGARGFVNNRTGEIRDGTGRPIGGGPGGAQPPAAAPPQAATAAPVPAGQNPNPLLVQPGMQQGGTAPPATAPQATQKSFTPHAGQITDPAEKAFWNIAPDDPRPWLYDPKTGSPAPVDSGVKTPAQLSQAKEIATAGAANTRINMGAEPIAAGVGKTWEASHASAISAAQDIRNIHRALDNLDQGTIHGIQAPYEMLGRQLGEALGLGADAKVANTQQFQAIMGERVKEIIKNFGSSTAISDADKAYAEKIAGGDISLDEKGVRLILKMAEEVDRQRITDHNEVSQGLVDDNPEGLKGVKSALFVKDPGQRAVTDVAPPAPTATTQAAPAGGDPLSRAETAAAANPDALKDPARAQAILQALRKDGVTDQQIGQSRALGSLLAPAGAAPATNATPGPLAAPPAATPPPPVGGQPPGPSAAQPPAQAAPVTAALTAPPTVTQPILQQAPAGPPPAAAPPVQTAGVPPQGAVAPPDPRGPGLHMQFGGNDPSSHVGQDYSVRNQPPAVAPPPAAPQVLNLPHWNPNAPVPGPIPGAGINIQFPEDKRSIFGHGIDVRFGPPSKATSGQSKVTDAVAKKSAPVSVTGQPQPTPSKSDTKTNNTEVMQNVSYARALLKMGVSTQGVISALVGRGMSGPDASAAAAAAGSPF